MKKFWKNKKLAASLICVLALGLFGCAGDDGDTTTTGDTISNDSSIAFTGKVVDPLGNPLSGVRIELISDKKQTNTTDTNGNWLINVDLGEIKAVSGGGGGDIEDDVKLEDAAADKLLRNYPIEISKTGFPTYRYEVEFEAIIGYTDGSGAVVLLSKTGNVQPTTILHPYVDNFEFKVYAGADPAPGAVVTLSAKGDDVVDGSPGANAGSVSGSRYEIDTKMFKANSEGVIKVTKDDKLPANTNYTVFAAPYDSDGDGVYEYDSSVATQPGGGFNLNVANVAGALIHYELNDDDAVITQTEFAPSVLLTDMTSDIRVTYLNIQNVDNIPVEQADDFEIVVMFNRPVTEQELASIGGLLFTLTGINGNVTIPFSQVNTGNYLYTLTPDSTLTPGNNQYAFTIANLLGSSGGFGVGLVQNFSIYDPDATMYAAITPGLDIEENRSFKVDWNDVLLGDPSETNPYTKANMIPDVRISWPAYDVDSDGVEDATGYEVWVKDSDTPWQNVTANFNIDYNDGQFYEAEIDLTLGLAAWGGIFDSFDVDNDFGLDATEPFFAQTLQIVIMPQNVNGFAMDPNTDNTIAGLALKDNWGPEVVAGTGWDGVAANATNFIVGTRYDATVRIAFDEPLKDATLTADYVAGGCGATVSSGSFKVGNNDPAVDPVRWSDLDLVDPETTEPYPSNRAYILVDFQPTVTTTLTADAVAADMEISVTTADMDNFARGDLLNIDDTDEERIVGFDVVAGTFTLNLGLTNDCDSGDVVYWSGPINAGYEDVSGTLNDATDLNDLLLYVESTDNMGANQTMLTTPASGLVPDVNAVSGRLVVTTAPDSCLASGSTVSGYSVRAAAGDILGDDTTDTDTIAVTTMAAALANQAVIVVVDATDITAGNILILDFGGPGQQQLTVQAVAGFTVTLATNLTTVVPGGTTVDERVDVSTTLAVGYPLVNLPILDGIKPNSNITFTNAAGDESDTAKVVGVVGNAVVIDDILKNSADVRYTFAIGADYTVDSSRVPDALQINVLDRAGIATSATDTDGDGTADRDQIGYEEVGGTFNLF